MSSAPCTRFSRLATTPSPSAASSTAPSCAKAANPSQTASWAGPTRDRPAHNPLSDFGEGEPEIRSESKNLRLVIARSERDEAIFDAPANLSRPPEDARLPSPTSERRWG